MFSLFEGASLLNLLLLRNLVVTQRLSISFRKLLALNRRLNSLSLRFSLVRCVQGLGWLVIYNLGLALNLVLLGGRRHYLDFSGLNYLRRLNRRTRFHCLLHFNRESGDSFFGEEIGFTVYDCGFFVFFNHLLFLLFLDAVQLLIGLSSLLLLNTFILKRSLQSIFFDKSFFSLCLLRLFRGQILLQLVWLCFLLTVMQGLVLVFVF